jgi:xylose isomerase
MAFSWFWTCLFCGSGAGQETRASGFSLDLFPYVTINLAVRANFEFLKKLGVNLWCFHDRDISPEGRNVQVCAVWT